MKNNNNNTESLIKKTIRLKIKTKAENNKISNENIHNNNYIKFLNISSNQRNKKIEVPIKLKKTTKILVKQNIIKQKKEIFKNSVKILTIKRKNIRNWKNYLVLLGLNQLTKIKKIFSVGVDLILI